MLLGTHHIPSPTKGFSRKGNGLRVIMLISGLGSSRKCMMERVGAILAEIPPGNVLASYVIGEVKSKILINISGHATCVNDT